MVEFINKIKKFSNNFCKFIFAAYRGNNYFIYKKEENLFDVISKNGINMEFKKYTKSCVVSVFFNEKFYFKYRFISDQSCIINQIKNEVEKNILFLIDQDQVDFVINHLKRLKPTGNFKIYFKDVSKFHKKYKKANDFEDDIKSKIHMFPYFDFSFKSIAKDITIFKVSNLVKRNDLEFIKFKNNILIKTKFDDIFTIVDDHIYNIDYKEIVNEIKKSINLDKLNVYFNYSYPSYSIIKNNEPKFLLFFNDNIFNNKLLFSDVSKCYRYIQKNNETTFSQEKNINSVRFVGDFFIDEIINNSDRLRKEYPSNYLLEKIRNLGFDNYALPLSDDIIDVVEMYSI